MTSFKQFLEEELLDEEFATHYDEISAEMDLALSIVLRREKLGLTQQQLADLTGMKQPMLARIESGQMPAPRTLQRLAKGLKVGVLFTGDGIMLLPMAGSKAAASQSSIQPVSKHEWEFPVYKKTAQKRQRVAECDYTLLTRVTEIEKVTGKPRETGKPRDKETLNASLETAA